jgi:uncharacterized protein YndB with AHSA1/START domain
MSDKITVEITINASIEKVWEYWTVPEHITKWAFASEDWEAPSAENNLHIGGTFKKTMAAKDGSASFDFMGTYTNVVPKELIEYDMDKAPNEEIPRHVKIEFIETPAGVKIIETFDPENENPLDMQRSGWQAILGNFKTYVEKI